MTKKHFIELAKMIANCDRYDDGTIIGEALVEDLMRWCKNVNPNFDRARFIKAAGIEQ